MKSYFVFLSRNKLYAVIEILGLSLALGFVLLLASYAKAEFCVGTKQPLSKQLYAIGDEETYGMTLGTAEEFFPSLPEIKSWTRTAYLGQEDIFIDNEYFQVDANAIDSNFLTLFDYRLTGCDKHQILSSTDQVIISESFARKAFAGENPLGHTITYNKKKLVVTGVIQDFGPYDIFKYCDIFISMDIMNEYVERMDNFGSTLTFVTLAEGANPDDVAAKLLDKYCSYWDFYDRDASKGGFLYGSSLTRLDKMYFSGMETDGLVRDGDRKTVEILLIVAIMLLISALFNYINITVALTGKRAKEMATRRLMGESRNGILFRYIIESFIFTLGCFVIGYMIAICFKPLMNELLSTEIVLSMDWISGIFSAVLICVISLIAGLLPASLASNFKPIDVVKGNFRFRSKMIFSKIFIICQNVISSILISVAITMTLQMNHLTTLPMGYNTNLIELRSGSLGYSKMDVQNELAKRLRALPQVEAVGLFVNVPYTCAYNGNNMDDEKMSWIAESALDSTSFRLLEFKVLEQYSEPIEGTYWFTEEAKRRYGITEKNRTVDKTKDGKPKYECCGIIADYRSRNALFEPMKDSHNAIRNSSKICAGMLIKFIGDKNEALAAITKTWKQMTSEYLGIPKETEIILIHDILNNSLTEKRNTMALVNIFMVLSILISVLGLFAMSLYYSEQQKKAIAIHKIAGAETLQAVLKLSYPFIVASLIAITIATPISIKIIQYYLEGFYNRISYPWWVLIAAAVISLVISTLSILGQIFKTAKANPIDSIKAE